MLRSRDNPRVKHWAKLARDARYRRAQKRALVEGPHLVAAALAHGLTPLSILATEAGFADREIAALVARRSPIVLSESVFRAVVDADSPPGVAAEIEIPVGTARAGDQVFLEGIQDPGNVGAILRTAAAFNVGSVFLDRACADPWSPKALRAGMGGQFSLRIEEVDDLAQEVGCFKGHTVCTVPRDGIPIKQAKLAGPVAWLFGSEGRGVSPSLQAKASLRVTIPTAPGTESLNVAAAAAVCLYEAFNRPRIGL